MEKHRKELKALIEALFGQEQVRKLLVGLEDPKAFPKVVLSATGRASTIDAIINEAFATDESVITVYTENQTPLATFFLVGDTDEGEYIADYSDNELANQVMQVVDWKLGRMGVR